MSSNEFGDVPHTIGCKIPQGIVYWLKVITIGWSQFQSACNQTTQIVSDLQVWATFIYKKKIYVFIYLFMYPFIQLSIHFRAVDCCIHSLVWDQGQILLIIGLPTLMSVAIDLLNATLRLDNELSTRARHGQWPRWQQRPVLIKWLTSMSSILSWVALIPLILFMI